MMSLVTIMPGGNGCELIHPSKDIHTNIKVEREMQMDSIGCEWMLMFGIQLKSYISLMRPASNQFYLMIGQLAQLLQWPCYVMAALERKPSLQSVVEDITRSCLENGETTATLRLPAHNPLPPRGCRD